MDDAEKETKLESSDISDRRESFYMPSVIMGKNLV